MTKSVAIRFPPGKYYVGDPCYAILDWNNYLNKIPTDDQGNWIDGVSFEYLNHQVWHDNTNFGDGTYYDQHGREYGVDAGIIGVIPIAVIPKHKVGKIDGGHFIDFIEPFEVSNENGMFHIGEIVIDTVQESDPEEPNEE